MRTKYLLALLSSLTYLKLSDATTVNLLTIFVNDKISHCPIQIVVGSVHVQDKNYVNLDFVLELLSLQENVQKYQQPFQVTVNRKHIQISEKQRNLHYQYHNRD